VAALFTEDGIFDLGNGRPREGRESIEKLVSRIPYGTVHVTTDAVIAIDGDVAHQEATLLLCKRQEDRAATSYWLSGRYHDELLRTDDGWRFTNRRAALDLAV
jgi:ketosteroid isomerase-like protein